MRKCVHVGQWEIFDLVLVCEEILIWGRIDWNVISDHDERYVWSCYGKQTFMLAKSIKWNERSYGKRQLEQNTVKL